MSTCSAVSTIMEFILRRSLHLDYSITFSLNSQAQVMSAVTLWYLVSDLWLSTSLQVLGMVWHGEFHTAVFICNNSFLTFLNRTKKKKTTHYLFRKEHHQCLIQLLPTRADCHQRCTCFSTNLVKVTNVPTDSLRWFKIVLDDGVQMANKHTRGFSVW